MQVDKTTLADLSIFNHEEESSVFHHLNLTHTSDGREHLRHILGHPLESLTAIEDVQLTIQQLMEVSGSWPTTVTNGTIMVMEKFFDTPMDEYPSHPNAINSIIYKLTSGADLSLTRYSVEHFISFLKGMQQVALTLPEQKSNRLKLWMERINQLLKKPVVQEMLNWEKGIKPTPAQALYFGRFIRNHFKQENFELINIYGQLDAYLGLALACKKYHYCFPEMTDDSEPFVEATQLYHPLLRLPVSYDVTLKKEENFLFLTGANMAGKSTFIKAVGLGTYLAHIGMGVPAKKMRLSFLDGLLSNIQVADNIVKGESYFFNEVQRIKSTVEKISDGKKWLILIDELFKGTNVQDAMRCSATVVEGLRKMNNAVFILSTHLYEIADSLKQYPNIQFKYFETSFENEQLVFGYQLKDGVSNDRLGYLILKQEGVVEMLKKL
jgi:DNA mismatch repair ATPase MutS